MWSPGQIEYLLSQERRLLPLRWAGVGLVLLVSLIFRLSEESLHATWWIPAAAFVVANVVLHLSLSGINHDRWSVVRLLTLITALDWIALGFLGTTWVYDDFFGSWPSLLFIPLIGALRFGIPGASIGWALASGMYLLTATLTPGLDPAKVMEPVTLVYRLGLLFLLAQAVGFAVRGQVQFRKRAESTMDQLRRSEAWRARLVATLGHDVRSPLGTVVSAIQLLRLRGDDIPPAVREDALDAIERQSSRALRLADDLLDMARLEHGSFRLARQRTDLVEIARRVVGSDRDIAIDAEIEPLQADVDPARIEQALNNLVANARKHGRPPILIGLSVVGDDVEITVEDHGPGLPEQGREQIFEAFTHGGAAASTGLGLWIVTALVEAHGGGVSYRDRPGSGARFVLSLPRWVGRTAVDADAEGAGVGQGEVVAGPDAEEGRDQS